MCERGDIKREGRVVVVVPRGYDLVRLGGLLLLFLQCGFLEFVVEELEGPYDGPYVEEGHVLPTGWQKVDETFREVLNSDHPDQTDTGGKEIPSMKYRVHFLHGDVSGLKGLEEGLHAV